MKQTRRHRQHRCFDRTLAVFRMTAVFLLAAAVLFTGFTLPVRAEEEAEEIRADDAGDAGSAIALAAGQIKNAGSPEEQIALMYELAGIYGDVIETGAWDAGLSELRVKAELRDVIPVFPEKIEETDNLEEAAGLLKGRKYLAFYNDNGAFCLLGDFYARLPEEMRAPSLEEADAILYMVHTTVARTDYIGAAFDRHYRLYLVEKDGSEVWQLSDYRTEPPTRGYGALYGAQVPMETLWREFQPVVYTQTVVEEYPEGTAEFRITGHTCSLIGLEGDFRKFEIPEEAAGYPVTGISHIENSKLTSLTLPEGIVYIHEVNCKELEEMNFPSTLERIGPEAFFTSYRSNGGNFSRIREWNLNEGLKVIGSYAIRYSYGPVTLPSTLQDLGNGFLMNGAAAPVILLPDKITVLPRSFLMQPGKVLAVYIPESVADMPDTDEYSVLGRGSVTICAPAGSAAARYAEKRGCPFIACEDPEDMPEVRLGKEGKFTYGILDDHAVVMGYSGHEKDVIVPDAFEGYPVTDIYYQAIYDNDDIQTIRFPDSLERICSLGVGSCGNLTEISMPAGVQMTEETLNPSLNVSEDVKIVERR